MIRTYTATFLLTASVNAGTVQFGNTFDPVAGLSGGGVPVNGELMGIQTQWNPTQSGGTASVATVGQGGTSEILLNAVGGTSLWYYPHVQSQTTAGAAITGWYDRFPIDDNVNLVVSGGTAPGTVTVKMLLRQ